MEFFKSLVGKCGTIQNILFKGLKYIYKALLCTRSMMDYPSESKKGGEGFINFPTDIEGERERSSLQYSCHSRIKVIHY